MQELFANRVNNVPKSFIREILKVIANPEIISFAGGLPNPKYFPIDEIKDAGVKVLEEDGSVVLQYSTTEGYEPLRQYICNRYKQNYGLEIDPSEVLITTGSQQALDLIGKVMLDEGDKVLIEAPGYLGAIQSFAVFNPEFITVKMDDDGVNIEDLEKKLAENKIKVFYTVPNFQNPSGITYSKEKREKIAKILEKYNVLYVEDDPYGELRFMGDKLLPVKSYYKDGVMLGSFSKVAAPAFRIGWVCAPKEVMEKLVIFKQAADLHTSYYAQRVLTQYLTDNDLDDHISKIKDAYRSQREKMVEAIEKYFPASVKMTKPEGGMFLWGELPDGLSSMDLFDLAIKENVAIVPGRPFYVDDTIQNTFRLNYSNVDPDLIEEGIKRLADAIKKLMNK